jgi:hypothetical protein
LRHRTLEIEGSRVHTNDRYGGRGKKDASHHGKGCNPPELLQRR